MTKENILNEFRSELTAEAVKKLKDIKASTDSSSPTYIIRYTGPKESVGNVRTNLHTGILGGLEAHPG
jgi:hypothetical protein